MTSSLSLCFSRIYSRQLSETRRLGFLFVLSYLTFLSYLTSLSHLMRLAWQSKTNVSPGTFGVRIDTTVLYCKTAIVHSEPWEVLVLVAGLAGVNMSCVTRHVRSPDTCNGKVQRRSVLWVGEVWHRPARRLGQGCVQV